MHTQFLMFKRTIGRCWQIKELGKRRQGKKLGQLWDGLRAGSEILDGLQALWDGGSLPAPPTRVGRWHNSPWGSCSIFQLPQGELQRLRPLQGDLAGPFSRPILPPPSVTGLWRTGDLVVCGWNGRRPRGGKPPSSPRW